MSTTWFITGTSSGLGRHLTELLLERGHRVAATLRSPSRLDDLTARYGDRLWVRELDVTDTARLREVVDAAFTELGRIDVVVSNAGFGLVGMAEAFTDEQIDLQLRTNVTAAIQLARAATPHLRSQGGGRLLQLSSQGGHMAFPGYSLYHASKWAVEGFFEALAGELEPFGITTTLVEPGVARTDFASKSDVVPHPPAYDGTPAVEFLRSDADRSATDVAGDPRKMADAIISIAELDDPPRRQLLGSDAYDNVTRALSARLDAARAQRDLAVTTDADDYTGAGAHA